jgi:5,10-methenyltetrahydromethanopterin hydrogenase
MSALSGLVELLGEMGVIAKGTAVGEKLLWVSEVNGERIMFKEKDLTKEIAEKILKHPKCSPVLARNTAPDISAEDVEAVIDQDELSTATIVKRGRKIKLEE